MELIALLIVGILAIKAIGCGTIMLLILLLIVLSVFWG